MWKSIDPMIVGVSKNIAEKGNYDDAIFAAFRCIEGEIQERISSKNIGIKLLNEAFDGTPAKISISKDNRDQDGIKDIFLGAFKNIRNDRGHKKVPSLPCKTLEECLLYLQFASFLLLLLSKDRNLFPNIRDIRLFGTFDQTRAEIRGENFSSDCKVLAEEIYINIARITSNSIEVLLPPKFSGTLKVVDSKNQSDEMFCDISYIEKCVENSYEILSTEIPLYEDNACTRLRSNVVGILLKAEEAGKSFIRIIPTYHNQYKAGYYVTHGPFDSVSVGETWYQDPQTREINYAWTSSLVNIPDHVCQSGNPKLGGISILPTQVRTGTNEFRTLRVIGWEKDGSISREVDITDKVNWKSMNENVAFIKDSVLYPKKLGHTEIECNYEGFFSSAAIDISNYQKGQRAVYFQGIKRIQQIRFDNENNMFLCNQSSSVYKIARTGGLFEVIRISSPDSYSPGIDCLAIDNEHNLYVNDMNNNVIIKYRWNGKCYESHEILATSIKGTKKSIAIDGEGNVFVAVMGHAVNYGYIIKIRPDGTETCFETRDTAIYIGVDNNGKIYVPSNKYKSVDVYNYDGKIINSINYNVSDTPSDILVDNDAIYIPFFHSGKIMKIGLGKHHEIEELVEGAGNIGGIAKDSLERIYFSDFQNNKIEVIY